MVKTSKTLGTVQAAAGTSAASAASSAAASAEVGRSEFFAAEQGDSILFHPCANGPVGVTILGATGSIGLSTCEVIRHNPDRFYVHGLAAARNAEQLFALMREFRPERVALSDSGAAVTLKAMVDGVAGEEGKALRSIEILVGEEGVCALAGDGAAGMVIGAIVGAAGLKPLLAAIKTGARICLANKEALVMSGQLFFNEVKKSGAQILPVDSEHSAIFQCLPRDLQQNLGFCDLPGAGVSKILLTGSGGPFRDTALSDLAAVTVAMAVNHPVWSMGPKISVDSATMMNKALEYIEARYLFNAGSDQVDIVIHPQSVIHSMVSYRDGAVLAQLGAPDMKTPIAVAMGFTERINSGVAPLDFTQVGTLTFKKPDPERYPCLFLGIEASKQGQACTTALNAANEEAVAAFLQERLSFLGISQVVDAVLNQISGRSAHSLAEILAVDAEARNLARAAIARLGR